MNDSSLDLTQRVAAIRDRVAAAAARSGRAADDITIVAAAKTRSAAEIEAVIAAGVTSIGHNYVQEATAQRPLVTGPATWRLIGPLQTNKINATLRCCDTVDTLHTVELAAELDARVQRQGRAPWPVLLQIRLGGEATKSGCDPSEAESVLTAVQQMPGLLCLGLMTMPPPGEVDASRRWFGQLRELAVRLRAQTGLALPVLSMGMSEDFELAVEEGATHVRLGTALFGPRPPR